MRFSTVTNLLTLAAFTQAQESTPQHQDAKSLYLAEYAPGQLARLTSFRAAQGDLTPAQSSVLDQLESIVKDFAVDEAAGAKALCESAFGSQQCAALLSPGDDGQGGRRSVGKRGVCECATLSPFCGSCTLRKNGCRYNSGMFKESGRS